MQKRFLSALLSVLLLAGFVLPAAAATAPAVSGNDYTSTCEYLDRVFHYTGKLGAEYTPAATTFRVWAPKATSVTLKRFATGSDEEPGAKSLGNTAMTHDTSTGVWSVTISGDIVNTYYTYEVTTTDAKGDDLQTYETQDVYSYAVGVNGDRTMVVDYDNTDPEGWENDAHVLPDSPTDSFVWEVHVKDFSYDPSSGVPEEHRGKYLAFTDSGTTVNGVDGSPTCMDYLKSLGVTTVQINPFNDFQTVDERDSAGRFNWGYDPKNYSVPEGSYSTNPYDGNVRIKECKQMIQALHNAGISVVMDVVYNHTYSTDSCFGRTLPKYYYRMKEENGRYVYSNGSGCGNETASERWMYRRFMVDSILNWANEYHIDGFRFDLMALHDVETLNSIRYELDKIDPRITLWGEGWTGGEGEYPAKTWDEKDFVKAEIGWHPNLNERVGFFNDGIRDSLRGNNDLNVDGWLQKGNGSNNFALSVGMKGEKGDSFTASTQVVSYAACHDNRTLWDQLCASQGLTDYYYQRNDKLAAQTRLSGAVLMLSQGATFVLAGEEMGRSKGGDHNSYNKPPEINKIDWNLANTNADIVNYYKGLRKIRENFDILRCSTRPGSAYQFIDNYSNNDVLACIITNTNTSQWGKLLFIGNASDSPLSYKVPSGNEQSWVIVSDGERAGLKSLGSVSNGSFTVPANSAVIAVDSASFSSASVTDNTVTLNVKFVNEATNEEIYSYSVLGDKGKAYSLYAPYIYDNDYILDVVPADAKGTYTEDKNIEIKYVKVNAGTVCVNYYQTGTTTKVKDTDFFKLVVGDTLTLGDPPPVLGYKLDETQTLPNSVVPVVYGNTDVNYYYTPDTRDIKLHIRHSGSLTWKPNVWIWGANNKNYCTNTKWPGDTLTSPDANGWYNKSFTAAATEKSFNLIVTNTAPEGWMGSQTKDYNGLADSELWIVINDSEVGYGTDHLIFYTEDPLKNPNAKKAGFYGRIPNENKDVEPPLYKISKDSSIVTTVSGCEADKTIAGAEVVVSPQKNGGALSDLTINDGAVSFYKRQDGCAVFTMPASDVTIKSQTAGKQNYPIDLTSGMVKTIPADVADELVKLSCYNAASCTFDFNSDSAPDAKFDPATRQIERANGADLLDTNYTFEFPENTASDYSGAVFMLAGDEHRVIFDPNGGTGTMEDGVTVRPDGEYTLPDCTFVPPEGMAFDYWLIGEERHEPGDKIILKSDVTASAKWSKAYTISFEAETGSGTMAPVKTAKDEYILPECTFTPPEGMIFDSWTVNGRSCEPGTLVKLNGDLTVTAAWKERTLTLVPEKAPTCEDVGNIEYYVDDNGGLYSDESGTPMSDRNGDGTINIYDVKIKALGHKWGEPEWKWTGVEKAEATFTCETDPAHTRTLEAEITKREIEVSVGVIDRTIYTATVELGGKEYKDRKEVKAGTSDEPTATDSDSTDTSSDSTDSETGSSDSETGSTDSETGSDTDAPRDSDSTKDSDSDSGVTGSDSDKPKDPDNPEPHLPKGIVGDLDDDGYITATDALLILRASLGMDTLDEDHTKRADVDEDGYVTSGDALAVLRASVGFDAGDRIGKPLE